MAEANNTNTDSQVDVGALQDWMKNEVKQYFDEQWSTANQQRQQQQSVDTFQQQRKQAGDFVKELVKDDLDQVKITAADAKDEVRFYRANPDAIDYEQQIEDLFTAAIKAGRPMTRQDILYYVQGKEAQTEPDKYAERMKARQQRQLQHAEGAVDIGAAALNKAKTDDTWVNFDKLSLEDMEKALEGITF